MERIFLDYGVLGAIVLVGITFVYKAGRWCGKHVLTPVVEKHIELIDSSIEMMESQKQVIIMMSGLNEFMRDCGDEMHDLHSDAHSVFGTVHTNKALHYLGEANLKMAKEIGVDVQDLIQAMQDELKEQKVA